MVKFKDATAAAGLWFARLTRQAAQEAFMRTIDKEREAVLEEMTAFVQFRLWGRDLSPNELTNVLEEAKYHILFGRGTDEVELPQAKAPTAIPRRRHPARHTVMDLSAAERYADAPVYTDFRVNRLDGEPVVMPDVVPFGPQTQEQAEAEERLREEHPFYGGA